MAGQVAGKVALVTGGASGIGAAVCELLAREGASVAVTDIDDLRGPEVVAGIKKAGGEAMFLHQDVTSEARWIEVVAEIVKRYGRLDILVSNAGIGISGAVDHADDAGGLAAADRDQPRRRVPVGQALPARRCARAGGGSIILMSSLAGLRGAQTLAGYCATKGGVRLFAKAIAMECASFGDGVRVNSVHPGIIDTPIWGKIPTEATGRGQNAPIDPEERAKTGDAVRPRRPGRGNRAGRAVSGVRRIELCDRNGTGHRRRHECGRALRLPDAPAHPMPAVRALAALPQPRQHLQPAITVGGQQAHLGLDSRAPPSWCRCRRGRRCRRCRSRPWSAASASPASRPASARARSPGRAG